MINHFSMGMVVPVLNLILLDRGATLQTLPLLYLIMSITTLVFELPSGICADMFGRKRVFLLSCLFNLVAFSWLSIRQESLPALIGIIILYGLGRAFASGSIDALIIDRAVSMHGKGHLPTITSRLAILEGAGLSLGSISGGFLAQISTSYSLILLLRVIATLTVMALGQRFLSEGFITRKSNPSILDTIRQGRQALQANHRFAFILSGGFFIGLILASIETYWQPAFMQISTFETRKWILGMITFSGFLAVTFGNIMSRKILDRYPSNHMMVYLSSRAVLAAFVMFLAFQNMRSGFVLGYAGIYLFLGISNISESTLVNQSVPDPMRASALSFYSFMTQIGLMVSAIISSIAIQRLGFSGIWMVMASLLGGSIAFMSLSCLSLKSFVKRFTF